WIVDREPAGGGGKGRSIATNGETGQPGLGVDRCESEEPTGLRRHVLNVADVEAPKLGPDLSLEVDLSSDQSGLRIRRTPRCWPASAPRHRGRGGPQCGRRSPPAFVLRIPLG